MLLSQVFGISDFVTNEKPFRYKRKILLWISTDITCTYNYDASSKIVFYCMKRINVLSISIYLSIVKLLPCPGHGEKCFCLGWRNLRKEFYQSLIFIVLRLKRYSQIFMTSLDIMSYYIEAAWRICNNFQKFFFIISSLSTEFHQRQKITNEPATWKKP